MSEHEHAHDEPWESWFEEDCESCEDARPEGESDLAEAWRRLAVMMSIGFVAVFAVLAIA